MSKGKYDGKILASDRGGRYPLSQPEAAGTVVVDWSSATDGSDTSPSREIPEWMFDIGVVDGFGGRFKIVDA